MLWRHEECLQRLALPIAQLNATYFNAHFVERDDKGRVKDKSDLMEPADFIPGMPKREQRKLIFRPGDIPVRFQDIKAQFVANQQRVERQQGPYTKT